MQFLQYVGETDHYMVFVDISKKYFTISPHDNIVIASRDEVVLEPIPPVEFEYWVKAAPQSGRFEVRLEGEAFLADENHRDSHLFYIAGYHIIKNLQIGEIIPATGFKTEEFLSDDDKKLLGKQMTPQQFKKSFSKQV